MEAPDRLNPLPPLRHCYDGVHARGLAARSSEFLQLIGSGAQIDSNHLRFRISPEVTLAVGANVMPPREEMVSRITEMVGTRDSPEDIVDRDQAPEVVGTRYRAEPRSVVILFARL